ncbi:chemotaxis protein CheW [Dyella sp. A6]|uniref:chemotaxis protein CheW n=1 Tax=Dyella aluminiiresistens TaxID=3069105 RepID=UPI002E75F8E4|nr:chemotaxis protein CheW [Dyella sp. A6]
MTGLHEEHTAKGSFELYGSFRLGGMELAMAVSSLQEVVNFPQDITHVPLAPSYALGLFNLRGELIPIIDLGGVLGLTGAVPHTEAKVAIVDSGDCKFGLVFDDTSEILRVFDGHRVSFERSDSASRTVSGVVKLDGGDRLLQILSLDAIAVLPGLPRLTSDRTAMAHRQSSRQGQRRQVVTFRVRDTHLALPMMAIHEIIRVPELQPSVLGSEFCLGLVNLRGQTVPVIDFSRLLACGPSAQAPAQSQDDQRIIVIQRGSMYFGLLVDAVESIHNYWPDDVLRMPLFQGTSAGLFMGCIPRDGVDSLILVDNDALSRMDVIVDITDGHRALYTASEETSASQKHAGARQTYVTFRLQHLVGLPISQLREVMDFPADGVRPPGAPEHVACMLNLRRRMIPIIDLRSLYGMPPHGDVAGQKVMVVEHDGECIGLTVDAVESIVAIEAADRMPVPRILHDQTGHTLQHDVAEVADLPDKRTLMLMDGHALAARFVRSEQAAA